MNREELEQVIYERTRNFVDGRVMDCIFELIAEEREACAKVAESYEPRCEACPGGVSNAIRARRET